MAHEATCEYTKADGTKCRATVRTDSQFCWFHDPTLAEQRQLARRRGGIARSRRAVLPPHTPLRPLASVADVLCLLEEAANAVRVGALEPRLGNCIGYLCSVALNGLALAPTPSGTTVNFIIESPKEPIPVDPNMPRSPAFYTGGSTSSQ
jgi:hypothetical protein